jgi:hypothetical protein
MQLDAPIIAACALVPGLLRSALVLLPEGLLIGGTGAESTLDHEPLVRAATACLVARGVPVLTERPLARFVEYAFVSADELVVIQRGRSDERLALAAVCTREPNLALVLSATRQAIARLEASVILDERSSSATIDEWSR